MTQALDPGTRSLLKEMAQETAKATVYQTLTLLGFDAENPLEVQKDMATLRGIRLSFENAKSRSIFVVFGVLVVAFLTAAWKGIKQSILGE